MKNSKKYAKEIDKLFRSLRKKHPKAKPVSYDDSIAAVIYGIVSEKLRSSKADKVISRAKKHFVDLNDLRVARAEEFLAVIGSTDETAHQIADSIRGFLNEVYDKYDIVSLVDMEELGKRQAHKELEESAHAGKFAVDYCFLTAMEGHAIPLNPEMTEFLKDGGFVDPAAKCEDIVGFLERHIKAVDGYEFYALLRKEVESVKKVAKKKAVKKVAKEKVEKKTAKKATAKKVVKKKAVTKKAVANTVKKATKKAKTKAKAKAKAKAKKK